jgi:hypothetical protein
MSAETENAIAPLAKPRNCPKVASCTCAWRGCTWMPTSGAEAVTSATSALDKGGLRQEGQAWLLRGMAEVRLKRFTDARRRFEKAAGFKETEKYAGQWLTYLESEAQRAEALSNS